ncbi:MAG: hypothetical protein QM774_10575 [Gordonia sp. (in: high G+C Gram-positive bacteria)]|uniref:hypothetical protein n=1 Tax=Gordonia sp. (in: high G+C Gram-positive bacteria) TaxID=84139 RepID=UPI0039E413EF
MRTAITRGIAVGVVAASAAVGAAAIAPEASAKVAGGTYRSSLVLGGYHTTPRYAVVHGDVYFELGPFGGEQSKIVPTKAGGYYDTSWGRRYVLNRQRNGSYRGPVYLAGIVIGEVVLTPSR